MSLIKASTIIPATIVSLSPLIGTVARRSFASSSRFLFESEKESQAQALGASSSAETFAQYRAQVVQKEPLIDHSRVTFVQSTGLNKEHYYQSDDSAKKLKELAKKVAYKD